MKIIGLYTLPLNSGDKCQKSILRTLKDGEYYLFYSGYNFERVVNDNENFLSGVYCKPRNVPENLYYSESPFSPERANNVAINICAIVGANGAGKSSVIELFMRIMNNVAALILGQEFRSPKSEHLHYVDNVYADLMFEINDNIYCLACRGAQMFLQTFKPADDEHINYFKYLGNEPLNDNANAYIPLSLASWFYTIISNYSLHAYSPYAYLDELTPREQEYQIRCRGISNRFCSPPLDKKKKPRKLYQYDIKTEDRFWMTGLFHKNDGYQTPLVITPMRANGVINVNKENTLFKERMMSLLFYSANGKEVGYNSINEKLYVDGFRLELSKKFKEEFCNDDSAYDEGYMADTDHIALLLASINEELKDNFFRNNRNLLKQKGTDFLMCYIRYKIVKIFFTYPSYDDIRQMLISPGKRTTEEIEEELLRGLQRLWQDNSHVTTKLRRCINYLRYNHIGNNRVFSVLDFSKRMQSVIDAHKDDFMPPQSKEELLPPRIFDIDFLLYQNDDIKKKNRIPLSTLSSGEKQITNTLSSIYYHVLNIDSVGHRLHEEQNEGLLRYDRINVIFDEIELYFHPEMQRRFINNLLHGLKHLPVSRITDIHIMVVTHSPFVLSDIPQQNILFLQKDGTPADINNMKTFGANIHSMLQSSFFLKDGAMGAFAQEYIDNLAENVSAIQKKLQHKNQQAIQEPVEEAEQINDCIGKLQIVQEPLIYEVMMGILEGKRNRNVDN